MKPDFAIARFNLGNALVRVRDVGGAIEQYQLALKLRPDDLKLNVNLANAYFMQGNMDGAIAQYRQTLKIAPGNFPGTADVEAGLGLALFQNGKMKEAVDVWSAALAIKPEMPEVQNRLAWVLATATDSTLRDGARALALATQANELTGGRNPVVLSTLAAAYAENKRFSEAGAVARRAVEQAEALGNGGLAEALRDEIKQFDAGVPMREEK